MNPTDPSPLPPEGAPNPEPLPDAVQPKPWHKDHLPPVQGSDGGTGVVDGSATGGLIDAGTYAAGGAIDAAGGIADAAGGITDAAGSALEGAGSALEAAGGCLDGCGGCSLALLLTLSAAASTAMALFR